MDYVHQCSSMSPQAVFNVFLKTAGAYDSDLLGKPAAASERRTVNTPYETLHRPALDLQLKSEPRVSQELFLL